jgi:diguanylate cyclase (GGDEF)-like protein
MNDTPDRRENILIIDDEAPIRNLLCEALKQDYICTVAASAEEALSLLEQNNFALVLSDIDLGGTSGLEIIPQIRKKEPDAVVVMISGNESIDSAIEAMRVGAFDYVKKPFDLDHLGITVKRALDHHTLLNTKRQYESHLEEVVRERTEQLNYLANYDALTGLPNRILFEDRLSQALMSARTESHFAILFIALDRFKRVRDTLGHSLGERILQEAANRLKSCVDDDATLSRFESDEFALLLTRIEGPEDVVNVIGNIDRALRLPILVDDKEIFVTTSIGVSFYPDDGNETQHLLKNASTALALAAADGGNSYRFYAVDMNSQAVERLTLENGLRRALERSEFELFYQPKIDISTRQIVGMEALIRWQHPELGLVPPNEFIPLAENTGQIVPIGEWVLREACSKGQIWRDEGFALNLSVNLSARQFQQQDLLKFIVEVIRETGFDPGHLDLEVTESSLMKNAGLAVSTLAELRKLGIRISIDDFGTGYSSLGYLKYLPIDILKIDRSFISDVTTNQDDAALVTTIITLAHNLRLGVVAEGVETEEQLQFLEGLKCDEWQGYLYSRPVPFDSFSELLTAHF